MQLLSADIIKRVVRWEASHLPEGCTLLHSWALVDNAAAFEAAKEMGLQDVIGSCDTKDSDAMTPLDIAINSNSTSIAQALLNADRKKDRQMQCMLEKHCPNDPMARSSNTVEGTNLYKR